MTEVDVLYRVIVYCTFSFAAVFLLLGFYSFYCSAKVWLWLRKNQPDKFRNFIANAAFSFKPFKYLINVDKDSDPKKIQGWKVKIRLVYKILIWALAIFAMFVITVFLLALAGL